MRACFSPSHSSCRMHSLCFPGEVGICSFRAMRACKVLADAQIRACILISHHPTAAAARAVCPFPRTDGVCLFCAMRACLCAESVALHMTSMGQPFGGSSAIEGVTDSQQTAALGWIARCVSLLSPILAFPYQVSDPNNTTRSDHPTSALRGALPPSRHSPVSVLTEHPHTHVCRPAGPHRRVCSDDSAAHRVPPWWPRGVQRSGATVLQALDPLDGLARQRRADAAAAEAAEPPTAPSLQVSASILFSGCWLGIRNKT